MTYKNAKLAAYALAGVIALSGNTLRAEATNVSSLLPAAGLALTLEEGSAQEEVRASTKSSAEEKEKEKKEEIVTSVKEATEANAKESAKDKESADEKEGTQEKDSAKSKESTKSSENVKDSDKSASKETKKESEVEIKTSPETKADKEKTEEKKFSIVESIKNENAEKSADTKTSAKETETADEVKESEEAVAEETETEAEKEEKEFSKLVIAKVNDYVNIRKAPSEDSEIVGKLYDKSVGDFIQERNGWYRITSGNVTGFVKAEYCVTGEEAVKLAKEIGTRVATVTTTTLKVRESAGTDATVLGLVPIEEELTVIEELDGWVKVDIEEGYGYVSADYVSLRTDFVKAESREEEKARLKKEEDAKKAAREAARKAEEKLAKQRAEQQAQATSEDTNEEAPAPVISGDSSLGQAVVDYAMQFVGNPYVYGGTSLTNGADCSGFVMSVYKNFGVSLPHSSSADRKQGYDVGGLENAQPGDLVCYSGHVGIYAGGGKLVHASTSKTGIIVSNANYRTPLAVRRIF